ncbi:hypothetical protein CMI37_32775, partial [Candidatus Pacearchaeota archaeon]|nr:hypothetical protein [Candidatus Pacearchaeota archaeon]
MGNLNLDLKSRQVFGEYLPSVYIGRTTIDDISGEDAGLIESSWTDRVLSIESEMSIYFTKDESIETLEDAQEWVTNNLQGLYLYATTSPISSLNETLEKSSLNLKDLVDAYFYTDTFGAGGHGSREEILRTYDFSSAHPSYDVIINYIKSLYLSGVSTTQGDSATYADLENPDSDKYTDFWGSDGPDGPWYGDDVEYRHCYVRLALTAVLGVLTDYRSLNLGGQAWHKIPLTSLTDNLIEKSVYDSEGNEIIQMANINLNFTRVYDESALVTAMIESAEKFFLIAFVGRDIDEITNENHALYNANFGDITYEHILENNVVPDNREQIFVEATDGSPYNGKPIQTLEQKYYIPQPVGQKTILKNLETLLSAFSEWKEEDEALKENSNNLAYIMQTKGKDIDLIPQLQLFRRTYPDKSSITKSGQMYAEFKKVLYTFNKKVALQTEVKKQLVMNTKIIDMRVEALNMYYLMPNPSFQASQIDGMPEGGSPGLPGWDLTPYVSINGPSLVECRDVSSKGIASDVYIPSQWSRMARNAVLTIPQGDLVGDFYEFAIEEGYMDAALRPLTYENVYATALADYYDMSDWGAYYDMTDTDLWARDRTNIYMDIVVANKGIFFFDWEKALHTQSHIAHIFRINVLQRLFHFTIPYKYFKVLKATLIREEDIFTTQMTEGEGEGTWRSTSPFWGEESGTVEIKIECFMRDTELPGISSGAGGLSVPWTKKVNYYYDPDNLKYGQPWVYNNVTTEEGSITMSALPAGWSAMEDSLRFGLLDTIKGTSTSTKSYSYLKFKNFDVAQPSFPGSLHGTLET